MDGKKMNEEQIKMLKNFGALGYPFDLCEKIMDFQGLKKKLDDEKSIERRAYESGALYAQYMLDLKLFEMASSGDLKALDKHTRRKNQLKKS